MKIKNWPEIVIEMLVVTNKNNKKYYRPVLH